MDNKPNEAEMLLLACLAAGPKEWTTAPKTLVEVRIPRIITELLESASQPGVEPSQVDLESALINYLVFEGLNHVHDDLQKKYGSGEH